MSLSTKQTLILTGILLLSGILIGILLNQLVAAIFFTGSSVCLLFFIRLYFPKRKKSGQPKKD